MISKNSTGQKLVFSEIYFMMQVAFFVLQVACFLSLSWGYEPDIPRCWPPPRIGSFTVSKK